MKRTHGIWHALWLWEDDEYKKEFLIELNTYLKNKVPQKKVDEYPKACCFDHLSDSEDHRLKYFIEFCNLKRIDPYVAHRLFISRYGCIDCDCQYMHDIAVTEDSNKTHTLENEQYSSERR